MGSQNKWSENIPKMFSDDVSVAEWNLKYSALHRNEDVQLFRLTKWLSTFFYHYNMNRVVGLGKQYLQKMEICQTWKHSEIKEKILLATLKEWPDNSARANCEVTWNQLRKEFGCSWARRSSYIGGRAMRQHISID